ncbi:hypothetical protein SS50377_22140 [Spironucleus salmonicida]|uniref:Uncharacterized protein n=1 Tax=Spironucleus salmonicida TaxID=348837 RepID=V6LM28_9EUKA|nr:hypothetical protein SS50377_22140 [Spironucleus salmonicida]|eukprot:EST45700.1 hypothetical protein SS50377_14271 [Spironucleus salmonicida]
MEIFQDLAKQLELCEEHQKKIILLKQITQQFPQCFGYWIQLIKLTDYNLEIIQQALQTIPHSIQIWVFYISYAETSDLLKPYLVSIYESALEFIGSIPESVELWAKYIYLNKDQGKLLLNLEPRLLKIDNRLPIEHSQTLFFSNDKFVNLLGSLRQFFHPKQLKPQEVVNLSKGLIFIFSLPDQLSIKVLLKYVIIYNNSPDFWWAVLNYQYLLFIEDCQRASLLWEDLKIIVQTYNYINNEGCILIEELKDIRALFLISKYLITEQKYDLLEQLMVKAEQTFSFQTSLEQRFYFYKIQQYKLKNVKLNWTLIYNDYNIYHTRNCIIFGCECLEKDEIGRLGLQIFLDGDDDLGLWIMSQKQNKK